MRAGYCTLVFALMPAAGCLAQAQTPPEYDFQALADDILESVGELSDQDKDGYGGLAWGTSYGMMALNVMYEATGDTGYLDRQVTLIEQILSKRDSDLAAQYGEEAYLDYQRNRVLQAWGTGHYSGGKHTCWIVHAGMLLYPMADFVRIVRAGGEKTAAYLGQAGSFVPRLEAAIKEFDADWRDGPEEGMGYYIFPNGSIAPNNQMNAPGRALFILYDLTGKDEYRDKAWKLAAFFKSKLTHVEDGEYYLWAYSQGTPEGPPGTGEDISHASINAHFMYVAWEHGASFDDTDMERLTRTFTEVINLGDGQLAYALGKRQPNNKYTPQCARWAFLARFDPAVELIIREYMAAHPEEGSLGGNTGALGFAYLLRAAELRKQGEQGG